MRRDRVVERPEGFYAIVDGREFGVWANKELARAGLRVEQRRLVARLKRSEVNEDRLGFGIEMETV